MALFSTLFCHAPLGCIFYKIRTSKPEVELRTQGSKPRPRTQKNSRPRTALSTLSKPRTGMLEARDQGHRRKCSPKKKIFKIFFQAIRKFFSGNLQKKNLKKIFWTISTWGKVLISKLLLRKAKKVLANLPRGFWRFPKKFQRFSKSRCSRAKDSAIFEDLMFQGQGQELDLRGQGQGLKNVSSRTFSRTPPLIKTSYKAKTR